MRRIWFTLLLALAVACNATASAWAMQACPYKAAPSAHDCWPQPPATPDKPDKPDHAKKMDCKLGQACRAAPAVAPQVAAVETAPIAAIEQPALLEQTAARSAVPTGLWRPPRTL